MVRGTLLGIGAVLAFAIVGQARAQDQFETARAVLVNQAGDEVGLVSFAQIGSRVLVQAEVQAMPPGFHGFHVHAVGVCTGDFTSAGGHLNLAGAPHPEHTGDMPALYVAQDGIGRLSFETDRFTVGDLFDADGSAVIVHANPDNYANIPARYAAGGLDQTTLATGDAGGRIACGVVE